MTKESKIEVKPKMKLSGREIFNRVVIFFVIGCVFGTYYEELLTLVKNFMGTGELIWESRRGLLYGSFSPVYGIGAVLIYLMFYQPGLNWWRCLVGGALFGGALEFGLSVVQEWMFGTISWDYSNRPLNIAGRTTIPYMLFWGVLVAVLAQWVCPWIESMCERVPKDILNGVCTIAAVILVLDIALSVIAAARQTARRMGDPADNIVEVMLDTYYNDERMQKTYQNTRPK